MEQFVPVIIPCREPDEKLLEFLENLKNADFQAVVLVDDGSEDEDSREILQQAEHRFGCTVLHHEVNRGKGRALKTAFSWCLEHYCGRMPGCVTVDCDGQYTVKDVENCMEALCSHPDSLILGARNFDREDIPERFSSGNRATGKVMKLLMGLDISDIRTGLRGIPGDFMEELLTQKGERSEFEINMLLCTKNTGRSIVEVPVETIYMEENAAAGFHPVKDCLLICGIFLKFTMSSLSSSVLDLILFTVFLYVLDELHPGGGSRIMAATVLARIFSSLFNYALNYKVVFQSKSGRGKTMVKYFALAAAKMLISGVLVDLLHRVLPWQETLIKIPVDVVLFFINYYLQREYVYH